MKRRNVIAIFLILLFLIVLFIFKPNRSKQEFSLSFLITEELVDYFMEEIEVSLPEEVTLPPEGFTPAILTNYYPSLLLEDFNGVTAVQGVYNYRNGTLEFTLGKDGVPHSAADSLSGEGMKTLLYNLAKRNEIILDTKSEIDDLIEKIQLDI